MIILTCEYNCKDSFCMNVTKVFIQTKFFSEKKSKIEKLKKKSNN